LGRDERQIVTLSVLREVCEYLGLDVAQLFEWPNVLILT
jgi:hypothetical protein